MARTRDPSALVAQSVDEQAQRRRVADVLAGAGLTGGLAQLFMTASLQKAPVAVVAPFDYLQIVGAIVFGWWLMAATPTLTTLAGAALIASSGLYTAWREHIRRKASLIQPTAPLV